MKQAVINDFSPAMIAYLRESEQTGVGKGFFGSLRIIFPAITFLGTLYRGRDVSESAVAFMEDYLGAVNPLYNELSDLLYKIYRHGLMHTQMPKVIEIEGHLVGWRVTYNDAEHLQIRKLGATLVIPVSPRVLFHELLKSIDLYVKDFDEEEKQQNLLGSFQKGFVRMAKVTSEDELKNACPKGLACIKRLYTSKPR